MSSKLKPCPFCGGPAEFEQVGPKKLQIRCRSCVVHKHQTTNMFSLDWLKSKMFEWWNTRPSPWQPIETAPKDGTEILVAHSLGYTVVSWNPITYRVENLDTVPGKCGWRYGDQQYGTFLEVVSPFKWMEIPSVNFITSSEILDPCAGL